MDFLLQFSFYVFIRGYIVVMIVNVVLLMFYIIILTWSLSRENYAHPEFHMERHLIPHALPSTTGPTDWNEALDIISFGSPEQVFYCLLSVSFIFICFLPVVLGCCHPLSWCLLFNLAHRYVFFLICVTYRNSLFRDSLTFHRPVWNLNLF